MLSIVLIGTGNMAKHLFDAFTTTRGLKVVQVVGRNEKALSKYKHGTKTVVGYKSIMDADIYIIAISDDAISSVSELLSLKNKLVVHTSGSKPLEVLPRENRRGSFYPLQTFSKERKLDFSGIPICIEAENEEDIDILRWLADSISNHVHMISSEQRKALHLAAVFINNFTNHLYYIGSEISGRHGLPFQILGPLMRETLNKIEEIPPLEAQTGPARRGDQGTMEAHLELLESPYQKEIYALLSKSIQKTYGEKL